MDYSEYAHRNLPAHLRVIHDEAKNICNGVFLPNARGTLREALVQFIGRLWMNAETFARLPVNERQAYAVELVKTATNAAVRRPKEVQFPENQPEVDIRVSSSTRNPLDCDPDSDNYGTRTQPPRPAGTAHIQGRADWMKANAFEDELIANIDCSRAAAPEPETEYERCVRLLGDDADWYWTVKSNHEQFRERNPQRKKLSGTESKRFYRLKCRLAA